MNYIIGKDIFDKFDWGCYVEGYKEAAYILLKNLPSDQNDINRNGVLPTLFIIRHFLELCFKEILIHEKYLYHNNDFRPIHSLIDLWKLSEPKIKARLNEIKEKNNKYLFPANVKIKLTKEFVIFLNKVDPDSFSFRYPKNKKDANLLPNEFSINIDKLKSDFEAVQLFLSNVIIIYMLNDKYY